MSRCLYCLQKNDNSTMSTANSQNATLCQANPDEEFQTFLKAFKSDAGLSKKDIQEYEETTVDDVNAILYAIQQKHISNNRQQYLKRLQVFIVNMESFGKVIEVFLNSTNYLGFVWVSLPRAIALFCVALPSIYLACLFYTTPALFHQSSH